MLPEVRWGWPELFRLLVLMLSGCFIYIFADRGLPCTRNKKKRVSIRNGPATSRNARGSSSRWNLFCLSGFCSLSRELSAQKEQDFGCLSPKPTQMKLGNELVDIFVADQLSNALKEGWRVGHSQIIVSLSNLATGLLRINARKQFETIIGLVSEPYQCPRLRMLNEKKKRTKHPKEIKKNFRWCEVNFLCRSSVRFVEAWKFWNGNIFKF